MAHLKGTMKQFQLSFVEMPHNFVKHCLTRITNAEDREGNVLPLNLEQLEFKVKSASGPQQYPVRLPKSHCECDNWRRYKLPCKHMFAIFHCTEGVEWYSLPSSYRNAPHISVDQGPLLDFASEPHTKQPSDPSTSSTDMQDTDIRWKLWNHT